MAKGKNKLAEPTPDPSEHYMFGLTYGHLKEIAILATEFMFDYEEYDIKKVGLGALQESPSPYNYHRDRKYIIMEFPLLLSSGEKKGQYMSYGFELKIFEDGAVYFENGSNVKIDFDNHLKIYKILLEHFNPNA